MTLRFTDDDVKNDVTLYKLDVNRKEPKWRSLEASVSLNLSKNSLKDI